MKDIDIFLKAKKKKKKRENGSKWYKKLPENEKQRLVKYKKSIKKYGKIKPVHKWRLADAFYFD